LGSSFCIGTSIEAVWDTTMRVEWMSKWHIGNNRC